MKQQRNSQKSKGKEFEIKLTQAIRHTQKS